MDAGSQLLEVILEGGLGDGRVGYFDELLGRHGLNVLEGTGNVHGQLQKYLIKIYNLGNTHSK